MEDKLFTFEVHHHGNLSITEGRYLYNGGKVAFYDDYFSDFINLWEIDDLGVDLGVLAPVTPFFMNVESGLLELISTDMDVLRMTSFGINKDRVCKIFFS